MKRIILFLFAVALLPMSLISQNETWEVKAMVKSGKTLPINAYLEDGTAVPVFAIYAEGNDHFMDVKAVHNGKKISVKLIASNDVFVPVKGITEDGTILNVKAADSGGRILDVKGVSRDGNTLNIAAIGGDDKQYPLMAVSQDGVQRNIKGIKFMEENVEMSFGDIDVIGHVKAIPVVDVGDIDSEWNIAVKGQNDEMMKLVAVNEKGKQYAIRAEMPGKHPYMMNVKAGSSFIIHIKLVKDGTGTKVQGIDEFGRLYEVNAVGDGGGSYPVVGGMTTGNVTPVYITGPDGNKYPVIAISSEGHEFDVKGIKVKEDDVEGMISGMNVWIRYFAHVKALAPASAN